MKAGLKECRLVYLSEIVCLFMVAFIGYGCQKTSFVAGSTQVYEHEYLIHNASNSSGTISTRQAVNIFWKCVMYSDRPSVSARYIKQIREDTSAYYIDVRDHYNNDKVVVRINKKDGSVYDPVSGRWLRRGYVNMYREQLSSFFDAGTSVEDIYKTIGPPVEIIWCADPVTPNVADVMGLSYWTRSGWCVLETSGGLFPGGKKGGSQ